VFRRALFSRREIFRPPVGRPIEETEMAKTMVKQGDEARAVTDAEFQAEVVESAEPVLVDFWAAWCGPCRMVAPIVEELAGDYAGRVKVRKLNVDENRETAIRYGVLSIPTLLLFRGGEVVESFVGVQPKETYRRALDRHLV
jgi:thioredoxin 1